ncbi:MAG: cyclic nucleotide-binding domain-containing protein, partial [Thermogutta sp.]|nr:cyclic nucleotide-binding domain-containing protein [Thermogutta sp.]
MSPSAVEILENCPFFADVNETAFRRLFAIARVVRFRSGQTIFVQNDPCPGMYVVGTGLVR